MQSCSLYDIFSTVFWNLAINYLPRTLSGGLLKMGEDRLLPKLPGMDGDAFTSGDERAVENPGLASIHTIFVREHNRIASLLNAMQPELSDEEVFQMTRRQEHHAVHWSSKLLDVSSPLRKLEALCRSWELMNRFYFRQFRVFEFNILIGAL